MRRGVKIYRYKTDLVLFNGPAYALQSFRTKSIHNECFWHGKLAIEAGLAGKPVEQATLESVLSGNLGFLGTKPHR